MYKFTNFAVYPIINGLSDYDAQNLILHNIFNKKKNYFKREINAALIANFNNNVTYESWEDVINEKDINNAFNIFLNIYLTIFHSSFPIKKVYVHTVSKSWLTSGIRISCNTKKKLYLAQRNSEDTNLINFYKKYCNTLSSVIKLAKKT
jgi:hypothetical protein